MKKNVKVFSFILIFTMMLLTFIMPIAYAKTTKNSTIEAIVGEANLAPINDTEKSVESNILGVMQWVGYAIALGMLIYIGIKYVTSAADERASLKGSLVKYVIGAILIAGAVTVVDIVFSMGNQPEQNQNTPASSGGISFNQTT